MDHLDIMSSFKDLQWYALIKEIEPMYQGADPAHDFSHIIRVYKNAQCIGKSENADMQVLLWAALLHDSGQQSKLSKTSPDPDHRSLKKAGDYLAAKGLPEDVRKKVLYAIETHRFSRGIMPQTLEGKILQDADRLDAIGAIGIARVFLTGGALRRELYSPDDPFCRSREPDDAKWNLDHFYQKLLKLESGMHTAPARKMAKRRTGVLRQYLSDLQEELEETEDAEIQKNDDRTQNQRSSRR
jgi:uncharacterized protein